MCPCPPSTTNTSILCLLWCFYRPVSFHLFVNLWHFMLYCHRKFVLPASVHTTNSSCEWWKLTNSTISSVSLHCLHTCMYPVEPLLYWLSVINQVINHVPRAWSTLYFGALWRLHTANSSEKDMRVIYHCFKCLNVLNQLCIHHCDNVITWSALWRGQWVLRPHNNTKVLTERDKCFTSYLCHRLTVFG